MSPAPGPTSPAAETAASAPLSHPPTANDPASITPGPSSAPSIQVDERVGASSSGGPKTCTRCGRHIESSEVGTSGVSDSVLNAAPSPSSVAFATDPTTSPNLSALLAGSSNSASTGHEAAPFHDEVHQMCSTCSNSINAISDSVTSAARSTSRDRRRHGSGLRHSGPDGESEQGAESAITGTSTNIQAGAGIAEGFVGASAARAREAPGHPWRRAPWARSQSEALLAAVDSNNPSQPSTPLSISIDNIGAGGDAHMSLADSEADFPPLARSPPVSHPSHHSTSPRLPLSPGRSQGATSPPTTPSLLARQTSFSRSQTSSSTVLASSSPVVNFPSRGRNRASSTSSSNGGATAIVSHHGRRPSTSRRLSRSNSSQGPTTTAFADSVASSMPLEGEKIEEDPFGPSAMTRPRLSTLTAKQMASSAVSNTLLVDPFNKPATGRGESEEESNAEARRLAWFRSHRPEPRREISKLRCTSRGRGCLFPGATFNGTQKSGRMSYDVTVQIVNVDMASSHLCGYLNIRGLTDDWPELTTYFDAEIIGQRHGFVTGKWGATEADDMKHWSRFSPFRPLKNSLTKPGLRFNHLNKPFIFMRWKERFLVPDHRVRDINGASFAGFYYVCVELGDEEALGSGGTGLTTPLSPPLGGPVNQPLGSSTVVPPSPLPRQRSASSRRRLAASQGPPDEGLRGEAVGAGGAGEPTTMEGLEMDMPDATPYPNASPMGRMSGFYFHEHSEPYQQLTLQHVPESSSSTFELR